MCGNLLSCHKPVDQDAGSFHPPGSGSAAAKMSCHQTRPTGITRFADWLPVAGKVMILWEIRLCNAEKIQLMI